VSVPPPPWNTVSVPAPAPAWHAWLTQRAVGQASTADGQLMLCGPQNGGCVGPGHPAQGCVGQKRVGQRSTNTDGQQALRGSRVGQRGVTGQNAMVWHHEVGWIVGPPPGS
jgi:hypothetical protein